MSVKFEKYLCDLNSFCLVTKVRPTGAVFVDKKTYRRIFDESKCTGCAICIPACPRGQ